ncbi:MAG: DUF5985 family protein [Polyangiaceae bacterium]
MARVLVYVLCATTSLICVALLIRAYRRARLPLLLWSSVAFGLLAVNNILLFLDLAVFPQYDLELARGLVALAGLGVLLFGLLGREK